MNDVIKANREDLANRILSMIENGKIGTWLREWRALDAPYNFVSKENYKGINNLQLSMAGYADPRFMTFKQAQDHGYRVQKGAKAHKVEFWQFFDASKEKDGENVGGKASRCVSVRYYSVFNVAQIDGVPCLTTNQGRVIKTVEKAETIIAGCPVPIRYGGSEAYYSTSGDAIQVPLRESFFTGAAFYSTLFHEMSHATGHNVRLDRAMGGDRFGSTPYAYEELIAEFGAAFISKEVGIEHDANAYDKHIENHAAYIKSWSKARFDKKRILDAISQANQAANMVLAWGK